VIYILFKDYIETNVVYHVVTITDLDDTLKYGIRFNDKNTYESKYYKFHNFIDIRRTKNVPDWVVRSKAIFTSMNFKPDHIWHSHSALLSLKIHEDLCWVCNENIANFLYEPLILREVHGFDSAKEFINKSGNKIAEDYWNCSYSFKDNLKFRKDKMAGFDAEVLVLHDILPKDIELLYIASDHKCMDVNKWKELFRSNDLNYTNC
jgi:hypothetical protein